MATETDVKLRILIFRKEYLFSKLQKVYNLSQNLNKNTKQNFIAQFAELEQIKLRFEEVVLEIMQLELQLKPSSKCSTQELDSFDSLYAACRLVALPLQTSFNDSFNSNKENKPSLPTLKLFEFDGELENWTTFYDTFLSLVHNRNFEDIDKFHYLLSCVRGPALNLVKKYPITANNYSLVWQSLIDKYQDNRCLINRYLDKILNFTPLTKTSAYNLNFFVETFDNSWKAIEALKIKDLGNYLMCHLALRALDNSTRKLFEESREPTSLPTFSELINFVNKQVKVLEHTYPTSSVMSSEPSAYSRNSSHTHKPRAAYGKQPAHNALMTSTARSGNNEQLINYSKSNKINTFSKLCCAHCHQNHLIYRCEQFRKLSPDDRINRVNQLKLCTNCLKTDHNLSACKSTMNCGVCASQHHFLLHKDKAIAANAFADNNLSSLSHSQQALMSARSVSELATDKCEVSDSGNECFGVVLGTARLHAFDNYGDIQDCRAVIDSGAQSSFISIECAQRLGLPRKNCPYSISGLGGKSIKNYGLITCRFKSRHENEPYFQINMVVVSKVAGDMPNISFPSAVVDEYKKYKLADPFYYKRSRVDMLLGNDIVSELIRDKPIKIKEHIPQVIETVFGFIISGRLHTRNNLLSENFHFSIIQSSVDKTLRDFWETEELSLEPVVSPSDQLAEQIYASEHRRDKRGRYVVPLPLVNEPPQLGDSRANAERRLLATERKLARSLSLKKAYNEFMQEYEQLGHMELYTDSEPSKYVIPHHSILRPTSSTTPLRVVFDASAKTSTNISLNDIQLSGPNLYRDIGSIILNFRLFEYCFSSDICKMYRFILLRKCDRKYQHILFRSSTDEPIKTYELKTVTYGLSSSPFLAIRTLLQLASDEGERFPSAARIIRDGSYMDDILWSCETFSQACTLQDELIKLLDAGGFILKKWSSNCKEFLTRIPVEQREDTISFNKNPHDESLKLLGLQFSPSNDSFMFSVNKSDPVTTKRSVLKILASIYDPVGFLAPCTFVAKCILQDLWKAGIGWDEQLPNTMSSKWKCFISELALLSEFEIERHVLLPHQTECELIGFCDASTRGYAACVYALSRSGQLVKSRLLIAKSKVAPVKAVTVPRLELLAAVLLSKQIKYICDILQPRVTVTNIIALSDSSVALAWIQTEPYKLKTFVCNRVTQIIDLLPPSSWRHIRTENNIADIGSRGVMPSELLKFKNRWLHGPQWLLEDISSWPVSTFFKNTESVIPEIKLNSSSFNLLANQSSSPETKLEFVERLLSRFSSYTKLQACVARILRVVRYRHDNQKQPDPLSTLELKRSEDVLVKLIQSAYFSDEINKLQRGENYIPSLRKLSPFLDNEGFLRVGGRLSHAQLAYNAKHPRLMPKNSRFTMLLIEYLHRVYLHAGPRTLHNIINQRYWILSARRIIRSVLSRCITCFKSNPSIVQPKMGDLPSVRLKPNKVFDHVGVDLGGPFYIKESSLRNAKIGKAYLVLFVCFSTKAVHLEVVSSLSCNDFLAALDRFVSRRGLCSCIYSDCGTNFIAAHKHLREAQKFLNNKNNQSTLMSNCAQRQIVWKFNPPSAPHMGGLWEAGIKSAKYLLRRSVGEKALTFEELSTIFCKIEAIMNSRPLCTLPASDNPNEFNVLTPGHFLIGKGLCAVPEYNLEDVPINRLSRWQYMQHCTQQFWKKWSQDYLNTLQQRAKWFQSPPNLKEGDIVLIKDDQISSCNWPLAKIEHVHPGPDGIVRKVTLRSKNNYFQRPVNKLCPFPYLN